MIQFSSKYIFKIDQKKLHINFICFVLLIKFDFEYLAKQNNKNTPHNTMNMHVNEKKNNETLDLKLMPKEQRIIITVFSPSSNKTHLIDLNYHICFIYQTSTKKNID